MDTPLEIRQSRRSLLKSATLAVPGALALSALGGFNQAAPAQAATGQWWTDPGLIPSGSQTFFSVFFNESLPENATLRADVEAQLGGDRKLRATNIYWKDASLSGIDRARTALQNGMVPRLDWTINQAIQNAGIRLDDPALNGRTLWRAVAEGAFDQKVGAFPGVDAVFQQIASLKTTSTQKFFFSLCHEPELINEGGGFWGQSCGTSADFRAAWQHCRNRAKALGATNILWVLSLASIPYTNTEKTWGDNLTATGSTGFYPGHDYVDWIGWDPFNRYRFADSTGHSKDWGSLTWTLNQQVSGSQSMLQWWCSHFVPRGAANPDGKPYKPVMLCETGTSDILPGESPTQKDPSEPKTAKDWMLGIRRVLANPNTALGLATVSVVIRGVIYFSINYYDPTKAPNSPNFSLQENKGQPNCKWDALSQLSPQGDWLFAW